ncbi:MAG: ATP-binding cassette domain-containing protein [Chitinophagaceae bacterium]|jgi:ABC-2 type transport system ATP-binding protein|nr:ATP-binding cassette domain-containing protein [Chitinophagaceae bacterium]
MQPVLEVSNLKKYFATQKAVDGVSFTIGKGSIFGLLGPNGAGKTTLLRMITGIFYPDEGQILFNGRPFNPESDVAGIGYMPEERGLYKKMKIGEQAMYLARLKGLSREESMTRIKEWFVKLQMESWWNKKVEDLSKGMSQKLQFVTTVLHNPDLIILDEPFSGLDPVNANLIKDEIFRLAQSGATIVFSTHRMEQVEEICDHIVLVNKGQKILDGTVKGIKQQFKEDIFRIAFDEPVLPEHTAIHLFQVINKSEKELILKKTEGFTTNDIISYFIHKGLTIHAFNEILPSLNDIFIRQVEGTPQTRQFETVVSH